MKVQDKETPSQVIKQILDILEAHELPSGVIKLIRKKCWHLADHVAQDKESNNADPTNKH